MIAVAALAACGGGSDEEAVVTGDAPPAATTAAPATTAEEPSTAVRLYFLDGETLTVVPAEVPTGSGPVAAATVRALLANEDAHPSEIPTGTEVHGVAVDGAHATVDLSRSFESGGGSASMQARVAQVVYTLTQWPGVTRVSFELDGEPVEAIGGEGVPAREVARDDFGDVLPAVFVDLPVRGRAVAPPLEVEGSASVFEANVSLRLEAADGRVLAQTFATAAEGAPGRGDFEATIDFDVDEPTDGTLVAFEASAADGSETHVVRVPVRLCPAGTNGAC